MEYKILCELIEHTAGRKMHTPKDFDFLSQSIYERTKCIISVSTLKRFFGYLSQTGNQSRSTLDILSQYVGYRDWSAFEQQDKEENNIESCTLLCRKLYSAQLICGDEIRVVWNPDRECIFKYMGNENFIVISSKKSKLVTDATFKCHIFIENEPLFLTNLLMPGASKHTDYICGSYQGIKFYIN